MSDVVIRCDGLGKRYRLGQRQPYRALRDVLAQALDGGLRMLLGRRAPAAAAASPELLWALKDVSFEVKAGELVGVLGANGSGKTTLLRILARIAKPTEGCARIRGRLRALLQVGTGFHPELTGRENVFYNGALLGMGRQEIRSKFNEIVAFSEIERFIDTPVKYYSSGMFVRLAFSVAAHLDPEILLVDEVLAVGDAAFQRKCIGKMEEVSGQGRTVLFVSHNMSTTLRLCSRAILLDHGHVVMDDRSAGVVSRYLKPSGVAVGEQRWPDGAEAPGDAQIRLLSVRVRSEEGATLEELDIRRPVGIELEYRVLGEGLQPIPKVAFLNPEGHYLFVSGDMHDPQWRDVPRRRGVFRSTCWVPGNFFAEGMVVVTPSITSLKPEVAVHARVQEAMSFQVVDRTQGDGTRGSFPPDWPGLVRPLLRWETSPTGGPGADRPAETRSVSVAGIPVGGA